MIELRAWIIPIAIGAVLAAARPVLAQYGAPAPPTSPTQKLAALGLDDLIRLAEEQNPKFAQAAFAIESAQGKALQAGLYPNPTLTVTGDELGDRTGPAGIWTAPFFTQEIITRGKLRLGRTAAAREVDQSTLMLSVQRYTVLTAVRQAYFDVLVLQRRIEILGEIVKLAEKSVANAKRLVAAKQAAPLALLQLEVDLERLRADHEASQRELPAAFRRLAAIVGVASLPNVPLVGALDAPLPDYDLERARLFVSEHHPEVQSARVGVERAQLLRRRAEVERVPNVAVGAGYIRDNQTHSSDWELSVSLPVPLWNRNQGNIRTAQAHVGDASWQVARIQNELSEQLAQAFREYSAARLRAERYRGTLLPKVREAFELSQKAFEVGQFDYLRVLQAQRSMAEVRMEYLKALGDAWKGASAIAGLMLEDQWPLCPVPGAAAPERKQP